MGLLLILGRVGGARVPSTRSRTPARGCLGLSQVGDAGDFPGASRGRAVTAFSWKCQRCWAGVQLLVRLRTKDICAKCYYQLGRPVLAVDMEKKKH